MSKVHLLSGGAAQGLVTQLQADFLARTGHDVDGSFGAVGAMKDKLLSGAACDVLILSQSLIDQLTASGDVVAGSAVALGKVQTGIAVKTGEPVPAVGDAASLKAALRAAKGIYFPDPVKATAGIHFMNVMKKLGVDIELGDRLHPYPNGAAAMHALSQAPGAGLIGCTQKTEILFTAGIDWVVQLPAEFELATVYTAAVASRAADPKAAADLIAFLSGSQSAAARAAAGFE